MYNKQKIIILNDKISYNDALLFIKTNKLINKVYINLDSIVSFICNKLLLSNSSKLKTKLIKQLGTYNFNGNTEKQIAKKIIHDMSKLCIAIYVYTSKYDVELTEYINKISVFNTDINYDIGIVTENESISIPSSTH